MGQRYTNQSTNVYIYMSLQLGRLSTCVPLLGRTSRLNNKHMILQIRPMSTQRSGHLERTAQEPRDESLLNVRLGRIDQVNERIRLFRLHLESGPVNFSAGQWLDTYVPDNPKPGGFTITSSPRAAADPKSPYFELAVQDSPYNPPAAWLWRSPSEILGSQLQVRVGGNFVFPPNEIPLDKIRRVVFVAGGVGINPFASMLGWTAEKACKVNVKVLYASKIPTQGLNGVLFLERIRAWFKGEKLSGDLKVFATGEPGRLEESSELEMLRRRLTIQDVKEAVAGQGDDCVIYVCGPAAMTDEIVEGLTRDGGMDKKRVMLEKWW